MSALVRWLEDFPLHRSFGLRVLQADTSGSHLRIDDLSSVQIEGGGLHGGVFFLFGAVAGTAALRGRLRADQMPVALDLSVTVCANTALGAPLHFHGRVIHLGGTVGVTEAEVRGNDGLLLALVRMTSFIKDPRPQSAP